MELTGLQTLRLIQSQVTDRGLEYLKGLTSLREVELRFTQVTDVGANDLKKALPNCRIHHGTSGAGR